MNRRTERRINYAGELWLHQTDSASAIPVNDVAMLNVNAIVPHDRHRVEITGVS